MRNISLQEKRVSQVITKCSYNVRVQIYPDLHGTQMPYVRLKKRWRFFERATVYFLSGYKNLPTAISSFQGPGWNGSKFTKK